MEPDNRHSMKAALVWVLLLAATAGTYLLTQKLGDGNINAASAFLSTGRVYEVGLYHDRAEPVSIAVRPGDEVLFVIRDDSRHIIAEERSGRSDARLVSGEFGANESYSLSFARQGIYSFYDRMNPDIAVSISVRK